MVLRIVRSHHERMDGSGFPDALAGRQIPAEARIVAVVDAFDAMTTNRAYRPSRTPADAVEELRRCAGDPLRSRGGGRVLSAPSATCRRCRSPSDARCRPTRCPTL